MPPHKSKQGVQELEDCEVFRIYYNLLGRLHIKPAANPMLDYELGKNIEIGFVSVPRSDVARAYRLAAGADQKEKRFRAHLDAALDAALASGSLGQIITGVIDAVQHVETVCLYIDEEVFSAMEAVHKSRDDAKGSGNPR